MKTLNELFVHQLEDMYDAEQQIIKALPKMAKAATCSELKKAFLTHLKESEGQMTKLEQVFKQFDEKARGKTCKAASGLLKEGAEIAKEFEGSSAINAALIAAAQKVEHYEIATYGCLHEWAELLGNKKAAAILLDILDEEKAANEILTALARDGKNDEALSESPDEESNGEAPARQPARAALLNRR